MKINQHIIYIVIIIAILFYFKKCNQKECAELVKVVNDTTFVQLPGKDSIVWKRIYSHGSDYASHDSFIEYSITTMKVDTANILADYFKYNYYEDTTQLQYATIVTKDSITQNKNWNHSVTAAKWNLPIVTKTVTYMQPRKSEWYVGLDFGYNNVGANLSFKDTLNRVWTGGVNYIGKFYYYIGKKWKL